MFFLDESRDLAVAQIPRCGINTIREWLGGVPVVRNDDARLAHISRRVAFIREPIDRLESAFSMFYWLTDYGWPHVSKAPVTSWETFIDLVLDAEKIEDEHWRPQSVHVGDVPNIYHKFETLAINFELYRPGILPHNNKTTRAPIIIASYRLDELKKKYESDTALYERAV